MSQSCDHESLARSPFPIIPSSASSSSSPSHQNSLSYSYTLPRKVSLTLPGSVACINSVIIPPSLSNKPHTSHEVAPKFFMFPKLPTTQYYQYRHSYITGTPTRGSTRSDPIVTVCKFRLFYTITHIPSSEISGLGPSYLNHRPEPHHPVKLYFSKNKIDIRKEFGNCLFMFVKPNNNNSTHKHVMTCQVQKRRQLR